MKLIVPCAFTFISIMMGINMYSQNNIFRNPYDKLAAELKTIDTMKAMKDEFLLGIGISPAKDKILIVKTDYKTLYNSNQRGNVDENISADYTLWLIDLYSGQVKILAQLLNSEFGINNPSWSPDGTWISFATFSVGGHSPMTTAHSWVIDSSGNHLQKIELPSPYRNFSDFVIKWESVHDIVIEGFLGKFENNRWKEFNAKFLFDCDTKILKRID